jgi:hypothetical protein
MKKIFGLAAALALFAGCDDGDMTFKTFDFTDEAPIRCADDSNLLFKINDNDTEVLILNIDTGAAFLNQETPDGEPRIINVGAGSNRIIYRNYSAAVTQTMLCSLVSVPPALTEEWEGDGQLAIITDRVLDDEGRLTGYIHQITLRRITFTKQNSNEEVTITDNNFGSISISLGFSFDFESTVEAPIVLQTCNDNPLGPFFSLDGREALQLTLAPAFVNAPVGTQTIELDDTEDVNDLLLRVYDGTVSESSICSFNPPTTPIETQRWTAAEGEIQIVTTLNDGALTHTIHLINVIFINGLEEYVVEEPDFIIGSFTN